MYPDTETVPEQSANPHCTVHAAPGAGKHARQPHAPGRATAAAGPSHRAECDIHAALSTLLQGQAGAPHPSPNPTHQPHLQVGRQRPGRALQHAADVLGVGHDRPRRLDRPVGGEQVQCVALDDLRPRRVDAQLAPGAPRRAASAPRCLRRVLAQQSAVSAVRCLSRVLSQQSAGSAAGWLSKALPQQLRGTIDSSPLSARAQPAAGRSPGCRINAYTTA